MTPKTIQSNAKINVDDGDNLFLYASTLRIKAKKLVVNAEYVYNATFDDIQKTTSTICQPINFSLLFLTTDTPKHTTAAKEKRLPNTKLISNLLTPVVCLNFKPKN